MSSISSDAFDLAVHWYFKAGAEPDPAKALIWNEAARELLAVLAKSLQAAS